MSKSHNFISEIVKGASEDLPLNDSWIKNSKKFSKYLSILVIIIATLMILGWLLDIAVLKGAILNSPESRLNSIFLFLVIGFSLLLLNLKNTSKSRLLVSIIGFSILVISLITILDMGLGFNIFTTTTLKLGSRFLSSFNFVLYGLILFFFSRRIYYNLAQILATITFLIGYLGLIIYLLGTTYVLTTSIYNLMAIYSAFIHIILSISLLATYPQEGIIRQVHMNLNGSYMARKMFPGSVIALTLITYMAVYITSLVTTDILDESIFPILIILVTLLGFFFAFTMWMAHDLNQLHYKQYLNQKSLLYMEGFFEDILESLREGIMVINKNNRLLYLNNPMQQYFPSLKGNSSHEVLNFLHKQSSKLASSLKEAQNTLKPIKITEIKIGNNYFKGWIIPQTTENNFNGAILSLNDITIQKEQEMALNSSLSEKELLLGEIHHRVKNNMQIISSLLRLQSAYFENEEVKNAFMESQNRIKTMALVHEKLYQSESFSRIELSSYIQKLSMALMSTYQPHGGPIKLETYLDSVNLGIDQAIPLGLMLNELITNSFKHAFKDKKEGTITINLEKNNDKILLRVKDDGIGFNNRNEEMNTLGLTLINSLSDQLDAELNFNSNQGLTVEVCFQMREYQDRLLE